MSHSDETARHEEVAPEQGAGDTWSEADTAAVEAEAQAGANGTTSTPDAPEPGGSAAPGQPIGDDPATVLARQRDEYLQALQRTQADFENYRKRIARLQEEQAARASSDLVHKILPVLDTLDLALAHQSEAGADSDDAKALAAARGQLLDVLGKEGLERVDEAGVPFDPSVHDAVAHTDGEEGSGEVVIDSVLRSGYRWRGQVVRPAMVSVRG